MKHLNYDKINTLYKRDMSKGRKGKIIIGSYANNEIEYLKDCIWECTEKIDGTNIGIIFDGGTVEFQGRTKKTNIPEHLLEKLKSIFTIDKLKDVFTTTENESVEVVLFGEGFGTKIQNGENYIPNGVSFILFDIFVNGWWLTRDAIERIAKDLNISTVPLIGYYTLSEAEEIVSKGFKSTIAHNNGYIAEGLVCKPMYCLKDRKGNRIMTKIKHVDYL
ncbi:MAG: RNA ligase family protein [Bacteroidales bacterium]